MVERQIGTFRAATVPPRHDGFFGGNGRVVKPHLNAAITGAVHLGCGTRTHVPATPVVGDAFDPINCGDSGRSRGHEGFAKGARIRPRGKGAFISISSIEFDNKIRVRGRSPKRREGQ